MRENFNLSLVTFFSLSFANMAVKDKQEISADNIEWNVDTEVHLFSAMNGHKPVGKILVYHNNDIFYSSVTLLFRNSRL